MWKGQAYTAYGRIILSTLEELINIQEIADEAGGTTLVETPVSSDVLVCFGSAILVTEDGMIWPLSVTGNFTPGIDIVDYRKSSHNVLWQALVTFLTPTVTKIQLETKFVESP